MEREENSDPIPVDIILEILARSSAKSIARFGIASKFSASILSRPDFTDLFLTRPSTRPRLLFAVKYDRRWCFFSSPQSQNPDEKPSLVVEADFLTDFTGDMCPEIFEPVSGLVLFASTRISNEGKDHIVPVICNPSTGQYARLPQLERQDDYTRPLLGYDPIEKQYKVLMTRCGSVSKVPILALGTGKVLSWRKINVPTHYYISGGICIDGVLYYVAGITSVTFLTRTRWNVSMIACFNVRHENLTFLDVECRTMNMNLDSSLTKLINYKGQLGVIRCVLYLQDYERGTFVLRLCLWTLEDVQCQDWYYYTYDVSANILGNRDVSVVGVTAAGEIILSMYYTSKPFFVSYFNPERKTLRKVEIRGFEESENHAKVYTFVDYAEDLKFIA